LTTPLEGRIFCQFLGELFKFTLLPVSACKKAMDCLLSTGDEEDVIAMVNFATSALPNSLVTGNIAFSKYKLSPRAPFPLNQYLQRFQSIRKTSEHVIQIPIPAELDGNDGNDGKGDGAAGAAYKDVKVKVMFRTKALVMDFLDLYEASVGK
jgi:hypothetical protein